MPGSVDFEYIGNDAGNMHYLVGKSNQTQLNFNLNLRRYKPTSNFTANSPWHYPANKGFAPAISLKDYGDFVAGTVHDFKKKSFVDRFDEKNAN